MSLAKDKASQIRGLADEIINAPEESGDVAALRADNIKLRGLLRGTYLAAEKLQRQIDPMWGGADKGFTDDQAKAADVTLNAIRHATGEFSGESQVIIGENVNIPIGDIWGDVLGH